MKLKTILASCLSLFAVIQIQGQVYYTESGEDLEEVTVLFLGYQNKLSFTVSEGVTNLTSKNAKITNVVDDPNAFIIVVNSKDSVELEWTSSSQDRNGAEILKTKALKIPVHPLPHVELCLGNNLNGSKIETGDLTLKYCYAQEAPAFFLKNLSISKWIVSFSGKDISFNGSGNILSDEALNAIKSAKKKSTITISTISTEGKVINGTFKK